MSATLTPAEVLARKFSELLRSRLNAHEMAVVIEWNKMVQYDNTCASHDFLDANEIMYSAMRSCGHELWTEVDTDGQPTDKAVNAGMIEGSRELWNAAWRHAKFHGFNFN